MAGLSCENAPMFVAVDRDMLQPALALAAWTFVMWLWMYATRLPAIRRQGLKLDPAVPPKDLMAALPANVRWKADNYNHLWEQPTIFYPIVIIAALLPGTGAADLGLAWAFVGLRVIHSVWQATINAIEVRFVLFALSSLVLLALVVRTWVALLA